MILPTPTDCKIARYRIGISQAALCKMAGVNENYVCRFEGKKFREPSGVKLVAIGNALKAFEIAKLENSTASPKRLFAEAKIALATIEADQKRASIMSKNDGFYSYGNTP